MFYSLYLKNIPTNMEDALVDLCFSYGASGVSEDLDFTQTNDKYEPETVEAERHDLVVYYTNKVARELLEELRQLSIDFEVKEQPDQDWLHEWKKGYEAFSLVHDIWVVPSWQVPPKQAQKVITIDPGLAFGTGTHATTQLASGLLKEYFLPKKTVLDVGTGTGVLAMLVDHLGAGEIEATEIDDMARNTAKENIALNQSKVKVLDVQIQSIEKSYDWVVANIIDGVLLTLKEDLMRTLKPGGYLLLTGILDEREQHFLTEWPFKEHGLQLIEKTQQDEWLGFLCQKDLH